MMLLSTLILYCVFISAVDCVSQDSELVGLKEFPSTNELLRTISLLENGENVELAEIVEIEERSEEGNLVLKLKTENREIRLDLQPSDNLIDLNAKLFLMDGDDEEEKEIDPDLRVSFYHGVASDGSPSAASLLRKTHGWEGFIGTETEKFTLHSLEDQNKSVLYQLSEEENRFLAKAASTIRFQSSRNADNMKGTQTYEHIQDRSSSSSLELEVALYTDEDMYTYVQQKYPHVDTEKKVQQIALTIMNTVSLYYINPSMTDKIVITLVKITIMKRNPSTLQKSVRMQTYLDNFCDWEGKYKNLGGANYDVGMLMGGKDMYGTEPTQIWQSGYAPIGRACLFPTKRSCALGEGRDYGQGAIMAHELGHNLGMHHDTESTNNCPEKVHMMSPTVMYYSYEFSQCSKNYLKEHLKRLDETGANCMRKRATTNSVKDSYTFPGERMSPDRQCSLKLGDQYKAYGWWSNCKTLWCIRYSDDDKKWANPMLPGTTCGDSAGHVCYHKKCQKRTDVINQIQSTSTVYSPKAAQLSLDQMCKKYYTNYPNALTLEKAVEIGINDFETVCEKGLLCYTYRWTWRTIYPAPEGMKCASGKVCSKGRCISESGASNFSPSDKFCQRYLNSVSARGSRSQATCTKVNCRLNGRNYNNIPVWSFNVCDSGQMCYSGTCKQSTGSAPAYVHTGVSLEAAKNICKQRKGSSFVPLCTEENAAMYPNRMPNYCRYDMCMVTRCYGLQGRRWRSKSAIYQQNGTKCGEGKTCQNYVCQ